MGCKMDENRFVAELAAEVSSKVNVIGIASNLIRLDLDNMDPQRRKNFQRQGCSVSWKGWKRDDIQRRVLANLLDIERATASKHKLLAAQGKSTGTAIVASAGKRVLRTGLSILGGGGVGLAVLSPFLPPLWAGIGAALLASGAAGAEKAVREVKKAKAGGATLSDLLSEIWDVVIVAFKLVKQKKEDPDGEA